MTTTAVAPNQPIARRPVAAAKPGAILPAGTATVSRVAGPQAPVKASGAAVADALAVGKAARDPKAFETALIRLTSEAIEAFNARARARQAFTAGTLNQPKLHAAEAALDAAYGRVRDLRESVGPMKAISWRLKTGFDLDATFAKHGLPLPAAFRPQPANDLLMNIAFGSSLAVTTGALAVLIFAPGVSTFVVAGPIGLVSSLFGASLLMIQGNGAVNAGDAGPDRVPGRGWLDASSDHFAGASPEAYRTAMIYLSTRAKMAQDNLDATKAKPGASVDLVRLARLELHDAYRDLHALAGSVSEVKAAAWKAKGFDVDAAWKTWGMPLPPLASLDRAPIVPKLDHIARRPAQYMAGLITTVAGAVAADLFRAGRIGGLAARGVAALYAIHPLVAILVAGGAGFLTTGWLLDGLNQLVGPRSAARAPRE
jgi:hypothetical protein